MSICSSSIRSHLAQFSTSCGKGEQRSHAKCLAWIVFTLTFAAHIQSSQVLVLQDSLLALGGVIRQGAGVLPTRLAAKMQKELQSLQSLLLLRSMRQQLYSRATCMDVQEEEEAEAEGEE